MKRYKTVSLMARQERDQWVKSISVNFEKKKKKKKLFIQERQAAAVADNWNKGGPNIGEKGKHLKTRRLLSVCEHRRVLEKRKERQVGRKGSPPWDGGCRRGDEWCAARVNLLSHRRLNYSKADIFFFSFSFLQHITKNPTMTKWKSTGKRAPPPSIS